MNVGPNEFSEVQINCAGKIASTKFLPPEKELYLDGIIAIENNTEILGSVQGKDAEGRFYTNNTSTAIWMISPKVDLEVEAPKLVHRGDSVTFLIRITNNGSDNLTDINVFDDLGEIGQIPSLSPAAFRVLQKERVVLGSMHDEIRVSAYDCYKEKGLCQPESGPSSTKLLFTDPKSAGSGQGISRRTCRGDLDLEQHGRRGSEEFNSG